MVDWQSVYPHSSRARQQQLEREREQRARQRAENARVAYETAPLRQKQRLEERKKQNELRRKMRSADAIVDNGKLLPTRFKAVGDTGSILGIIGGILGSIFFSMLSVGVGAATGMKNFWSYIPVLLTLASVYAIVWGIGIRGTISRAKRYARLCGTKMYSQLSKLASATGLTEKALKKDIKKMLNKGYFPEGYLDEEGTTLMLSDDVYKEYAGMKSRQKAEEEAVKAGELSNAAKTELDQMVEEGAEAVARLHRLNADIPGEVITKKLDVLEDILRQIFARVKDHPEQMDRMHKLMDYYLPTMLKLVEAYAEYDKVSAPGKEITEAKAEIEKTLDTINEAFIQLLNNLFQDSVWDVTSDAQVLTTMLSQEGLTKEPALKQGNN